MTIALILSFQMSLLFLSRVFSEKIYSQTLLIDDNLTLFLVKTC